MLRTATVLLVLLVSAACDDDDEAPAERVYELTLENLTEGQPFSPGVVVTHGGATGVFLPGRRASEGLRLIAEQGDPQLAVSERTGRAGIEQVVTIAEPTHRIGGAGATSQTLRVAARGEATRVSLAVMLICTNDGFTGVEGALLPLHFEPVEYSLEAYDAGTELNDERFANIVDACQAIGPVTAPADGDGRAAEEGVITLHQGIRGVGNLIPALHGWVGPVGRLTIQRIQ